MFTVLTLHFFVITPVVQMNFRFHQGTLPWTPSVYIGTQHTNSTNLSGIKTIWCSCEILSASWTIAMYSIYALLTEQVTTRCLNWLYYHVKADGTLEVFQLLFIDANVEILPILIVEVGEVNATWGFILWRFTWGPLVPHLVAATANTNGWISPNFVPNLVGFPHINNKNVYLISIHSYVYVYVHMYIL